MNNIETYTESFKMKYEAFINGCDSIEDVDLWDKEKLGEMDAFYTNDLLSIIIRLVAVDGNISEKEVEYINKSFGFEYTQDNLIEVYDKCIDNIGNAFDENFENGISYMRKINDRLADAYKELLVMICEIIINSDNVVTTAEIKEVKKLKAMCE